MNEAISQAHVIIVDGPESGREISVPDAGARMGRVSGNDIVFKDPSMSRFQCRLFFKDEQLWINDLGSTNESLVNDKPVQEAPLYMGDHIILGQTVLKVICNAITGAAEDRAAEIMARRKDAPAPKPAPAPEPPPPAADGTAKGEASPPSVVLTEDGSIDLGLKPDESADAVSDKGKGAPKALWIAVIVLALAAAAVVVYKVTQSGKVTSIRPVINANPDQFAIFYEKVVANEDNVFRLEMKLVDNKISAVLDDIQHNVHDVVPPEGVNPETVTKLKNEISAAGFSRLEAEYAGIGANLHDVKDLTVVIGSKVHRTRVKNRVPPQVFRLVSEKIEDFVTEELDLLIIVKPPEELRKDAQAHYELARKLKNEINVRPENHHKAIQQFHQVEMNLRTLDPQPEIYRESIIEQEQLKASLEEKLKNQMFLADRARSLDQWETAARHLRTIKLMMPKRGNKWYQDADRKLLTVERKLQ